MPRKVSVRTHFPGRSKAKKGAAVRCAGCGQLFAPARSWSKFCSDNCRKRAWDKKKILDLLVAALNEAIEKLTEQVRS